MTAHMRIQAAAIETSLNFLRPMAERPVSYQYDPPPGVFSDVATFAKNELTVVPSVRTPAIAISAMNANSIAYSTRSCPSSSRTNRTMKFLMTFSCLLGDGCLHQASPSLGCLPMSNHTATAD